MQRWFILVIFALTFSVHSEVTTARVDPSMSAGDRIKLLEQNMLNASLDERRVSELAIALINELVNSFNTRAIDTEDIKLAATLSVRSAIRVFVARAELFTEQHRQACLMLTKEQKAERPWVCETQEFTQKRLEETADNIRLFATKITLE